METLVANELPVGNDNDVNGANEVNSTDYFEMSYFSQTPNKDSKNSNKDNSNNNNNSNIGNYSNNTKDEKNLTPISKNILSSNNILLELRKQKQKRMSSTRRGSATSTPFPSSSGQLDEEQLQGSSTESGELGAEGRVVGGPGLSKSADNITDENKHKNILKTPRNINTLSENKNAKNVIRPSPEILRELRKHRAKAARVESEKNEKKTETVKLMKAETVKSTIIGNNGHSGNIGNNGNNGNFTDYLKTVRSNMNVTQTPHTRKNENKTENGPITVLVESGVDYGSPGSFSDRAKAFSKEPLLTPKNKNGHVRIRYY